MTLPRTAGFAMLMVGLSSIGFGLVPYFARTLTEAGLAAPAIALFRYMIPAVAFLPFLRLRGAQGRASLWAFCSGLTVGLGWIGYVLSLGMMSVPTAAVLYMTYPLFTLIIGWLFFQDRPTPRAIFGSILILAAALLATSQAAPVGAATVALTGFALFCGLTAPVSFGLAINVLARRLTALSPLSRMAAFTGGSVLGLLPLVLTYPASAVFPADSAQWLLVLALGLGSALVPQLLYNAFVPRIGAPSAAALGSIELPTMFAIGWIALGDSPGPREIAAGALVLTAILLTPAQTPSPKEPESVT